ncbi:unnamed protein product [Brassicogethes aeneus]|uniref:Uncharacterized protein n=1 Tax=Brassicogethes aeneus TaxID=1431903 RepID=A0A9P0FK76_BRAAE|nr:unnamed protein product [Brassicogethes aeneus]
MDSKNIILQENLQQIRKITETCGEKVNVSKNTQKIAPPAKFTRSLSNGNKIPVDITIINTHKQNNKVTLETNNIQNMNIKNASQNPSTSNKTKALATPQSYAMAAKASVLTDNQNTQNVNNYTLVQSKKKKKNLGTNESSSGFVGVEKRVWIYFHRIQRTVTKTNIESFIKDQPGLLDSDINVKELPTSETQNKCFVLDAHFDLKDKLYDPSFWPKGVGIKRYRFDKHRENNKSFL